MLLALPTIFLCPVGHELPGPLDKSINNAESEENIWCSTGCSKVIMRFLTVRIEQCYRQELENTDNLRAGKILNL